MADHQPVIAETVAKVTKTLNATLPHIPATSVTVTTNDHGLLAQGRNLTLGAVPLGIVAGMALPVIDVTRNMAQRQKSGKNMAQIYGAMIAYYFDENKWPQSFSKLAKSQSLPDRLFQSPTDPAHPNPYLFIIPVPDPPSAQPVLIEDPACHKGVGTMVCFGDGHVEWKTGKDAQRLWAEATRLAALPKAKQGGISIHDWIAVKDILGVDIEPRQDEPAEPPVEPPGDASEF